MLAWHERAASASTSKPLSASENLVRCHFQSDTYCCRQTLAHGSGRQERPGCSAAGGGQLRCPQALSCSRARSAGSRSGRLASCQRSPATVAIWRPGLYGRRIGEHEALVCHGCATQQRYTPLGSRPWCAQSDADSNLPALLQSINYSEVATRGMRSLLSGVGHGLGP